MSELQSYLDHALKKCNIANKKDSNDIYEKLANEIINLRMEKGITQKELASLCGIQQSNISRIEKAVYNPSVQLLEKIANATGKELKIEFI